MATQRIPPAALLGLLAIGTTLAVLGFGLGEQQAPHGENPGGTGIENPPLSAAPGSPSTPERAALAEATGAATDDAKPGVGARILSGRVVQTDDRPLPPTSMFVTAPHRSLLTAGEKIQAVRSLDVPPDGRFHFTLPDDIYDDTAFVTVVGGHGDMTLLSGLVKIAEDTTIRVDAPTDDDAQPLTGTIVVHGEPAHGGDLLLLHRDSNEPISFQWNQSGNEIDVALRVLKQRFDDVLGPSSFDWTTMPDCMRLSSSPRSTICAHSCR